MTFGTPSRAKHQRRDAGERRAPPPLDAAGLDALAVRYVSRFATTTAKLGAYLRRKLRERGGDGLGEDDIVRVVARCVRAGYVDDDAYAGQRAASLGRRGFGHRRIAMALGAAGIEREVVAALTPDEDEAFASAERFASRRRIGRFATAVADRDERRRQLGAMLRAGHSNTVALRVIGQPPVDDRDIEEE